MNIKKIDALELLQSLDDKSVDLILTDPPYYKLLKEKWDNQWKTKDDYLNWLEQIIKECQRVLKDNGSFYMFCGSCVVPKCCEKMNRNALLVILMIHILKNNIKIKLK